MAQKPSIPKGTRDFSPAEVLRRHYIISIIEKHFKQFGFQPIETPSFENNSTLLGKYGEEGDRLIFKILNSGEFLDKVDEETYASRDSQKLGAAITEKALRYDLTVPFARYVVQHQNEIDFPFKRYQIQNVWRADRPQKGRFREFTQCDADVVGSNGLIQEVELIQLYDAVFTELQLEGATIKLNNRKLLAGIAEMIGAGAQLIPFTVALDKLDKIGRSGVEQEMRSKGISDAAIEALSPLFTLSGSAKEKLNTLEDLLENSTKGQEGISEVRFILDAIEVLGLQSTTLDLDITLARGLDYYTGAIFEVAAPENVKMGSIGGGGRYDDLTGIFGLKDLGGVGISFGLDRIYLVLEELDLFPEQASARLKALFINFGQEEAMQAMKALVRFRESGIAAELYPDDAKLKKQFTYADRRDVPYVILIGKDELAQGMYTLKDMKSGEQQAMTLEELLSRLR
ncbi:histidine--tRNA ligase [Croceiramulus getboli]|nr:histidine--tRNA ligase [Flavobacteriaceae bacterium YJPT1-3]